MIIDFSNWLMACRNCNSASSERLRCVLTVIAGYLNGRKSYTLPKSEGCMCMGIKMVQDDRYTLATEVRHIAFNLSIIHKPIQNSYSGKMNEREC
ncbi:hypothetical protein FD723_41110 (plasmid) [Nostoc sp. C052]|uniref:hypothetical protein n=1 Tax=Nostoc sp. C052 TaxID=2576902 RepID=UPI0015C4069D|nr:hypothetical protein [Nostoc sp. C052]QLE46609.1 hypothetical protein FD723_41110 [Nostoc sp. C052]